MARIKFPNACNDRCSATQAGVDFYDDDILKCVGIAKKMLHENPTKVFFYRIISEGKGTNRLDFYGDGRPQVIELIKKYFIKRDSYLL